MKIKKINYNICSKCVCDTTIPGITFNDEGICQYCDLHDELVKVYPSGKEGHFLLKNIIKKIKVKGKNKKYDCVVGVSGGTDSSYLLYVVKKLGLKPLAVHYDNGWNSPIAVENIKALTEHLKVDLYTYVNNWEEFKDLQKSFLYASVSDAEIPTDVGIHGCLMRVASLYGIKFVINGHSFRNESLMPIGWTYMDGEYISSVHKKFGTIKLSTFPNVKLKDYFYYSFVKGIKQIPLLNYIKFDKTKAIKVLETKNGWKYSGGHHHESYYTEFFQSFLLPTKFNIDKRITEYAGFIRTGQINREQALNELKKSSYPFKPELVNYTLTKLDISKKDFDSILKKPLRDFTDYGSYYNLILIFKSVIHSLSSRGIIPHILYQKFFT